MSAMPMTSGHARELMGDAMDSRALNMRQHQMLVNDTPEADCITDLIVRLVNEGVKPSRLLELLSTTRAIVELNAAEGGLSMKLAGELDQIANRLHDLEMNSGQRRELTVKEIGRALRDALPVLHDPAAHSVGRVVRAGAVVDRILAEVPSSQLFTPSVHKELRDTNYQRLLTIWAERAATTEGEVAA